MDWMILPGGVLGGLAMAALFGVGCGQAHGNESIFYFTGFPVFPQRSKRAGARPALFVVLSFYTRCFDRSSKVFQLGISLRRVSQAGIAVRVVARMASNASSW